MTTVTTDLAGWLLEQIAEDEADARLATTDGGWPSSGPVDAEWTTDVAADQEQYYDGAVLAGGKPLDNPYDSEGCGIPGQCARHIARWDPARVLAECEAKRRIVEQVVRDVEALEDRIYEEWGRSDQPSEDLLRLLALPYADREGYCEEWRV